MATEMALKPVIRIKHEGHVIEAFRVDVEVYGESCNPWERGRPKERSRLEVWVNGAARGYLVYPNGWGGAWEAFSLGPGDINIVSSEKDCWYQTRLRDTFGAKICKGNDWRNELLKQFPKWIGQRNAPSRAEIEERVADLPNILEARRQAHERRLEREAKERKEQRARWDAASARIKAEKAERARQVAEDAETLEALLARRNDACLTNAEVDCLERIRASLGARP